MLVLASASPRRHDLLITAGLPHVIRPSHAPETRLPDEKPAAFVKRLAELKARSVPCSQGDIVLAADTVVVISDQILEKPADQQEAVQMLRLLSGRQHQVFTGICLLSGAQCDLDVAVTTVQFIELTSQEIETYVQSGEPFDKAGGYAIQGLASKFVSSIQGCYYNVVGLPLSLVYSHLKKFGNFA